MWDWGLYSAFDCLVSLKMKGNLGTSEDSVRQGRRMEMHF
jgi:hypothetical protein